VSALRNVFCGAKAKAEVLWDWLQWGEPPRLEAEMVALYRETKESNTIAHKTKISEGGEPMIYKRGKTYWYKFMWKGKLIRESTKQRNDRVARNMESAHRTSLAKGEVGIREKNAVPTLASFLTERILPWAEATFAANTPKNAKWYRNECRVLREFKPLASAQLDSITGELASEFAAQRIKQGKQIATVNSSLRVLRRILNLAVEWGVMATAPRLKVLSGERRRERVVSAEEGSQVSHSSVRTARINRYCVGGYRNAARGMLSDALGECNLAQWAERSLACDARKNGVGTSCTADDSASACYTRKPMARGG
jgi:Phage integrase SAM-like domain